MGDKSSEMGTNAPERSPPGLGKLAEWLAVVSVAMTSASYFRVYGFYSSFGIRVGDFFSIADYLPTTITDILFAIFVGIAWTVPLFMSRPKPAQAPAGAQEERRRPVPRFLARYGIDIFVGSVILVGTAANWWYEWRGRYTVYAPVASLLAIFVVARYLFPRLKGSFGYRGARLLTMLAITAIVSLIMAFCIAKTEAIHIIDDVDRLPRVSVYMRTPPTGLALDGVFLGQNSRYVFLYRKDPRETVVLPISQVDHYTIDLPSQ